MSIASFEPFKTLEWQCGKSKAGTWKEHKNMILIQDLQCCIVESVNTQALKERNN